MNSILTPQKLDDNNFIFIGRVSDPALLSNECFAALWRLRPTEAQTIIMFGDPVPLPRRQRAFEPDYAFSGTVSRGEPVPAEMEEFLAWAQQHVDPRLNGLLVNWYDAANGDYIGAHRDSERGLINGSSIATISIGWPRTFRMEKVKQKTRRDFPVANGDVIVIPLDTNRHWKHSVPHLAADRGRRISVTLRAFADGPTPDRPGKAKPRKERSLPNPIQQPEHPKEVDHVAADRPLLQTGRAKLFTVGYGGRGPTEFAALLKAAGVRTVIDVRLRPDRAVMGAYQRAKSPDKGIEALLRSVDIAYCSCVELGNLFMDEKAFPEWRLLYADLLQRAGDLLIGRLVEVEAPVVLLCCEKDVQNCHRKQIAEYLAATQGFEVEHL